MADLAPYRIEWSPAGTAKPRWIWAADVNSAPADLASYVAKAFPGMQGGSWRVVAQAVVAVV